MDQTSPSAQINAPCALVLGASGVLGSAIAREFAVQNYRVLSTGFQRLPEHEPALQFDATKLEEWIRLEEWLKAQTPRIDVVVHCLGSTGDQLLTKMDSEEWDQVLGTNLKSAYHLARTLLPRLVKQREGQMIFIHSWAGRVGRAGQSNYSAAKAALGALSQSIAREYASRGIRSNVIVPGVIPSPMTKDLSPEALEKLWAGAALKDFSDLGELARFTVHLASMRGATGQMFQIDGRIAPQ